MAMKDWNNDWSIPVLNQEISIGMEEEAWKE
jgi:hypothetical protein